MSVPSPTALSVAPDGRLLIVWSDGGRRAYDVGQLRSRCPCATCAAEPWRASDEAAEKPRITRMSPVGNYGYRIVFADGHDTGIFPLDLLRTLGESLPDEETGS